MLYRLYTECNCVSLFIDSMFDSIPEKSPTAEKDDAAVTPSVDLFGAGTGCGLLSFFGTSSSSLLSFLLSHLFYHTSWFVPIVVCDLCMHPIQGWVNLNLYSVNSGSDLNLTFKIGQLFETSSFFFSVY